MFFKLVYEEGDYILIANNQVCNFLYGNEIDTPTGKVTLENLQGYRWFNTVDEACNYYGVKNKNVETGSIKDSILSTISTALDVDDRKKSFMQADTLFEFIKSKLIAEVLSMKAYDVITVNETDNAFIIDSFNENKRTSENSANIIYIPELKIYTQHDPTRISILETINFSLDEEPDRLIITGEGNQDMTQVGTNILVSLDGGTTWLQPIPKIDEFYQYRMSIVLIDIDGTPDPYGTTKDKGRNLKLKCIINKQEETPYKYPCISGWGFVALKLKS